MTAKTPLLLLCLMLLSAAQVVIAQDEKDEAGRVRLFKSIDTWGEPERFEGRLFMGLNCTQVNGDAQAGFHKAGFSAGGAVYVHVRPSFGISMELMYSQKGVRGANVKESLAWGTYFDKYYLNLDYAEAALLLHLDGVILNYEAGMSYGRLTRSREWAESDVPIVFVEDYSYFSKTDLCYLAGISLRFQKSWRINVHYQYSALTIRPSNRVMPRYSNGQNQFNEMFSFRLVYTL